MLNLIVRWVLLAFSLIVMTWIVPGIFVSSFVAALIAAIVIGFINIFVRPLVMFLTLPINLLTLGLFTFVINALLLMLAAYITPGFAVSGFGAALIGSLVLSVFSLLINWAAGELQPA